MTRTIFASNTEVEAWRPVVEQLLRGVVFSSPMLYTIDDLFVELRAGKMQLWLFYEEDEEPHIFAVTRIAQYPRGKIAVVLLCAGRRIRTMIQWASRFEAWAKMMQCDYVHFCCNHKLLRIMKRQQYFATAYAVYKPLRLAN